MNESQHSDSDRRVVLGAFSDEAAAQRALDELAARDFPLDRVSVLGKAGASGDDPLGIYYPGVGERMKGWGRLGAFWGGLFGLLGGAAGLFMLPGVGAVVALGPVAEALVAAAAGAGVGGGVMLGGAALTGLTQAVHQLGVPEQRLDELQDLLMQGRYLVMLIVDRNEADGAAALLETAGAERHWTYPYVGLTDALSGKTST